MRENTSDKRHFLVTGATSGIGASIVRQLANEAIVLVFVGRSEEKSCQLLEELRPKAKAELHYLLGDLSEIAESRAVAEAYCEKFSRLDVLINNAGAMFGSREMNADGLEKNIALNYLSCFILSTALQGLMQETAAAHGETRILNVSSEAHLTGIQWEDIFFERSNYSMMLAYGQSKAMMTLFSAEHARRTAGTGLVVNSVHPGGVRTELGAKSGSAVLHWIFRILSPVLLTADKSASELIRLASSSEYQGITGQYFERLKQAKAKFPKAQPDDGERLWAMTERWLEAINVRIAVSRE